MKTVIKWAATVGLAVGVGAVGGVAVAQQSEQDLGRIVYSQESGDLNLTPRLVVRGQGCFDAEDMTVLRLVAWKPSMGKVVYRCSIVGDR